MAQQVRENSFRLSIISTFFALGLLIAVHETATAQNTGNSPEWSIATSLTYPIARIYQIHISYNPGGNHEYFFGPAYQNFTSGSITSNAMTLIVGYRFFLWKNLHLEAEIWPAYNPMYSNISELHYRGVEIWGEFKIGYKFSLFRNMFIQPSPGIGFGILRTNKPPNFSTEIKSPIFAPQLIVGLKL